MVPADYVKTVLQSEGVIKMIIDFSLHKWETSW